MGINNHDLEQDLKRVANKIDKTPTAWQYNKHGKYNSQKIFDHYGGWYNALAAAELLNDRREVINTITEITQKLGKVPTMREAINNGVDQRALYSRFESWDAAIEAANIDKFKPYKPDSEELINDLKKVNNWLNKPASTKEYDDFGIWSAYQLKREFGNWTKAQKEAGEDISHRSGRKISDDEYLKDLSRVIKKTDGGIKVADYRKHGKYSAASLNYHFGSFKKAVKRAKSIE